MIASCHCLVDYHQALAAMTFCDCNAVQNPIHFIVLSNAEIRKAATKSRTGSFGREGGCAAVAFYMKFIHDHESS